MCLGKPCLPGVACDGVCDFECESKRIAGGLRGDARWCALPHGLQEVQEFEAQRLGTRKVQFAEEQAG